MAQLSRPGVTHRRLRVPHGSETALGCALLVVLLAAMAATSIDRMPLGEAALALVAGVLGVRRARADSALKRHVALSSKVTHVFSLRRGLDHAIYALCDLLRADQRADLCLVVLAEPGADDARLYAFDNGGRRGTRGDKIDAQLRACLFDVPGETVLLFDRRAMPWRGPACKGYDCGTLEAKPVAAAPLLALADLLEVDSLISVPLRSRERLLGRVYVASCRVRHRARELYALAQVLSEAGVLVENLQLIDRLALEVAAEERRRISLDLHDGTIQPYIGLKLGLEALRNLRAVAAVAHEVDELINMAADGIAQLRHYVGSLKGGGQPAHGQALLPAVRRQAQKFSEFYGIEATVVTQSAIPGGCPLYNDVIQIVREGLSNIRRHTPAQRAYINLSASAQALRVELVNDEGGGQDFFPRSIGERALALGGRVSVEQRTGGHTAVVVELPL